MTAVGTPPASRLEAAPPSNIGPKTIAAIHERIAKSGADVGIAFETLDGRLAWSSRGDDIFHAASTMKIPVMIELFHQAGEGKLKLTDPLPSEINFTVWWRTRSSASARRTIPKPICTRPRDRLAPSISSAI